MVDHLLFSLRPSFDAGVAILVCGPITVLALEISWRLGGLRRLLLKLFVET
jgi:hypothetical protein